MSVKKVDTQNIFMKVQESDYGYLKIEELKEGWCYRILARNAHIGIWKTKEKGFIISRKKLGNNYLFIEYHWDSGNLSTVEINGVKREIKFGTVKPFFAIEKAPFSSEELSDNDEKPKYYEIMNYLNNLTEKIPFKKEIKKFLEQIKSFDESLKENQKEAPWKFNG